MTDRNLNLAALIGSRICHDLISPMGAVSNGLELLEISGGNMGDEITLAARSAIYANARIRLFRIAFGIASPHQTISSEEVSEILSQAYEGGRIKPVWSLTGDVSRQEAKMIIMAIFCAETALPCGGKILMKKENETWMIDAHSERIQMDETLWARLDGQHVRPEITPAQVQFLLLPAVLAELGRRCAYHLRGDILHMRM